MDKQLELQESVRTLTEQKNDLNGKLEEAIKKITKLEEERDSKLEASTRQRIESLKESLRAVRKAYAKLKEENDETQADLDAAKDIIDDTVPALQASQDEVEEKQEELKAAKSLYEKMQTKLSKYEHVGLQLRTKQIVNKFPVSMRKHVEGILSTATDEKGLKALYESVASLMPKGFDKKDPTLWKREAIADDGTVIPGKDEEEEVPEAPEEHMEGRRRIKKTESNLNPLVARMLEQKRRREGSLRG